MLDSKSKGLTFIFSLIPGVGHLYLGLTKQGLQLLIGTAISIIMIPSLPLIFPFVLAIIWFYAVFDALQKVTVLNYYIAQLRDNADGTAISEIGGLVHPAEALFEANKVQPLWMGIASIGAGVLILTGVMFPDMWAWILAGTRPITLLAVLLIIFGVEQLFLGILKRKSKKDF